MDEKKRIKKKRATVERQEITKDSDAAAAKGVLQPLVRMMPGSVVILKAQMGDQLFAAQVAQRIFELHQLDKQVMFRIQPRNRHRRLEIKAEPFLNSQVFQFFAALGQIEEEYKIEHNGGGEDGIPAEKIDLDLHRVAKPAEDIDVVPTLFVITAWRVIVNANLVVQVLIKLGIKIWLQDVLQHRELGFFLGFE